MSEETSKTYIFDSASKNSLDPNALLAMMNNNGGFGGNGSWIWIIFLFFLYGWRGNGFGQNGSGLGNQLNNDFGRDLLLQAINGNGNAISALSTTLNCDINAVQTAINAVQSSVASVGSQVGMSGMQVINAIQSGNQALASQLAQCCCDNKLLVTTQGYETRIATAEQTALLGGKIDQQTTVINDKFCQLEMREMQNKIDALREAKSTLESQISNANQTAQIQAYIASVVTPIATEVNDIKSKLPQTVTLPYSCATAVPTATAAALGLGYGYGLYGNTNSIWA